MVIHTPTNLALQKLGIYVRADADDWQYNWPVHTHEGLEVYYFQRGNANYVIGEEIYDLFPGDMLLFRGSTIHRVNPSKDVPYIRSYVNFTEAFLREQMPEDMFEKLMSMFEAPNGMLIRWSPEERDEVATYFRAIHRENEHESFGYQLILKTLLTQLLIATYRKAKRLHEIAPAGQQSHSQENVRRILQYINQHYTENFSLQELSKELYLNKYYMCHCFKEVTGSTINNYVISKRIEEAKKLLRTTDEPVAFISEKLGFNTAVHFSRSFKKFTGISPQHYRKQAVGP
ncbi:AraC-like ligand binding domain-containing protein [Paenibacillus sp. UNCCL117]|uniref:helix-turn-helix domain-containing protein n=1 Tax=unclassified Paenibacillus TaxID=185978 RepID=UPI00087E6DE2|nr:MULTISPECIES: helix-turn-helix domain-containing protein [unclassified Paenibacillus]SDE38119.1 AraC-like ligand binding domain-containing protein [Paenibacillus sp. cl123]SFW65046.1 AraC-like ligand binding domain-containing protein [Paenibacillus sp. UNCCL117]